MIKIREEELIRISWGALGSFLAVVIGFVFWLSSIHSTTLANTKTLEERGTVLERLNETLTSIDNRLSNIEGYLKAKENKQ